VVFGTKCSAPFVAGADNARMNKRRCWGTVLLTLGLATMMGCGSEKTVEGGTIVGVEMAFQPAEVTTEPGKVRFVFRNAGQTFHELAIERRGQALGRVSASPGASGELEVDLDPGTYEMTCREPGHYEAGMRGRLRVEKR
jgi:uncharacterized cupredoxin-like copper-binding protein